MESLEVLPTALNTRVVFPPPPPTSNSLTSVQRAQLRKSTKKLGQILGETPHLLDEDIVSILGPVHVELPPRNEAPSPVYSDSSLDSSSYFSSSSSSLSHCSHPYAVAGVTSFESRPLTPRTPLARKPSLGLRSPSDRLTDHSDSHSNIHNKPGPPILRLAVSPPPSPTSSKSSSSPLTSSPVSNQTFGKFNSSSIHKRSTSIDDDIKNKNHSPTTFPSSPSLNTSDMKFTLHTTRPSTAPSRVGLNNYEDDDNIPESSSCHGILSISASASSVRRRKMERLRKILGYDVPMHLVFPDQEKKVVRNNSVTSTIMKDYGVISSPLSPVAVAGTVIPRSKVNGKITSARDSIGEVSPHRANRQEHQKIRKSSRNQHVKSSSLPSTPSPPALVRAFAPLPSPDEDTAPKRLCVIVESPEEHGSSGLEGFGLGGCTTGTTKPRMTTKKSSVMGQPLRQDDFLTTGGRESQRVKEEDEATMNKLWSTRRGYTGWDRSMTLGRISESPLSLSALEDEKSSMIGFRKSSGFVDF